MLRPLVSMAQARPHMSAFGGQSRRSAKAPETAFLAQLRHRRPVLIGVGKVCL